MTPEPLCQLLPWSWLFQIDKTQDQEYQDERQDDPPY